MSTATSTGSSTRMASGGAASINDYEIEESERRYRWERPGEESS